MNNIDDGAPASKRARLDSSSDENGSGSGSDDEDNNSDGNGQDKEEESSTMQFNDAEHARRVIEEIQAKRKAREELEGAADVVADATEKK